MTTPPDEHRFKLLVESISDYAIYMLDLDGCVVSWNLAAERMKGYTRDEINGQHFSRFFSLEDRRDKVPEKLLAEALNEGRHETEGWRLRKDGSRFWALATVHALREEDGTVSGFAKITRDMTEQHEAQQALIESEQRFRLLVEGVTDYAIYMLDVDGTITNWNRGAERIKGYKAGEVVGLHFSLFYPPEDRRAGLPARTLEIALRDGRFEAEGWRLRKDGSRFWAWVIVDLIRDDNGRHIGFAKITRDISERRAVDQALAHSERQFRMLVDGVVDYSLFMLDPNGIVTNWNTGAERIKGYTADEIVGQHVSRFYTEADRAAGMPLKALNTATDQGRYEAEGWRVKKDGSLFWANVVIDVIHDESGKLAGFAKITRDITDKKNAQAELQRAHEKLAQAQKMEALGQLTGGVAHDFNNLLMVVSGQAQMLRNKVGDDPRALKGIDAIEQAARRGEELTRHLLSFARRQRLQPVTMALSHRIGGLKELISTSLGASVSMVFELPKSLWPVEVDPSELELSLLNLAINARDAMPSGGTLSIFAENVSLRADEGDLDLEGDFVALSVSDTGVGIPPDILPRIFDPFFTTKEVSKGTGLGLSQLFGFTKQSGGQVVVRSELGQGACFTLYLPRASGEPAADAGGQQAIARDAVGSAILVVEDNPEVAEVAAGLLEQLGHRVRVVNSTAGALKALEDGDLPDLVFSDVVMAGELDGIALARRLRELHPQIPVLLATGYSQAAERLGDEFPILRKPYQLAELNRAINTLLAGPPTAGDSKVAPIEDARRARAARRDRAG